MSDLKKYRVLVTPTSFGKNEPSLCTELEDSVGEVVYNTTGRPLDADQLIKIIPGFDGYIAGLDDITHDAIIVADRLKVIARYGVGIDKVDLDAAREKGIIVTNTPNANASSVAELTVGLIIALIRQIPVANAAIRTGEWPRLHGISLEGKTVGIFGFGAIGQRVARRLTSFGCQLITFDPYINKEVADELEVEIVTKDEIVRRSDILSLHCPAVDETRGMVNTDFLAQMKPGSYLINTARGDILNETALYESIQKRHLSGAALDVFSQQPPNPENPLLNLHQVILTPHMGAHTDSATYNMGWGALQNCLAVLRGENPPNKVI